MDEQPKMPTAAGETLLRQWGAAEAARQAGAGAAPLPVVEPPGPAVHRIGRVAAVAAAVLLAAGVGLLAGRRMGRAAAAKRSAAEADAARIRVAALQADLVKAGQDLATAERLRTDAEKALFERAAKNRQAVGQLEARIAKLQKDLEGVSPSGRDKLAEQLRAATAALDIERGKLADKDKQVEAVQRKLKAAVSDLTRLSGELADVRKRLTSAATELTRVGQAHRRAIDAAKQLNADLLAARTRQQATLAAFQKLYLSAAAPGQSGWGARKSAAQTGKLSDQVARLRAEARTAEGIKLLAKLEVVLTRLELLDTNNVLEVQSFTALIASSGLAGEIDDVLAAGKEPPPLRAWLLEARLIVLGGARVG